MTWETAAALGTAVGTLILAIATFASVISANRSAKVSERSLMAALRPLLIASRPQDVEQKIGFVDDHFVHVPGGQGTAEVTEDAVYLTLSLRNAGPGLAILHGWYVHPERLAGADEHHRPIEHFHRLTRDIYIASLDVGFWQGALREPDSEEFQRVHEAVSERRAITIDLLYGDVEGGQRVVSRFALMPGEDHAWLAVNARHWNIDRDDPR